MRKYLPNSEEAICRILAAAVMADGALDKSEIDLLDRGRLAEQLGVAHGTLDRVVHEYCDDLQQYGIRNDSGALELGRDAIDGMLGEVSEPALQGKLLAAIIEITCADRKLDVAEVDLTAQATLRWRVSPSDVGYELHAFSMRWPKHFTRASMGVSL
jgi:uncharacterized tellurite resistance protein B-like protein